MFTIIITQVDGKDFEYKRVREFGVNPVTKVFFMAGDVLVAQSPTWLLQDIRTISIFKD